MNRKPMDLSALDAFLWTDPLDSGCEQAMDALHVYAELTISDPEEVRRRYPGITAHLRACEPCADDLAGLLAAIDRDEDSRPPEEYSG
jgi:hypothetical protein